MELRKRSRYLHFIHTIKKGTVVELTNQSPSGVPARKFRNVKDIYGDEDSFRDISLAVCNPSKKSSASVRGCSKAGMGILFCSDGYSIWNDPLSDEAACSTDADDFSSDDLTLRQFKDKCKKKGKKRKASESDFGNEISLVGKGCSDSQPNDDETDLMQPLRLLMSNLRKKGMVNVVENPDLLSQSQNTVFNNNEWVTSERDPLQQDESTNEHCKLADTVLQLSCSHNQDDNSDSSYTWLNLMDVDPTSGNLPGRTAKSCQVSKMMHEEHTISVVQNQESLCGPSDCSTSYPSSGAMTTHKETEKQEYPDGASQSLQRGCLQEDDNAIDVCSYALSSPIDLVSQELDKSEPQSITSEIISQAGNDHVSHSPTMKTSLETEIMPNTQVVCQSSQQLCPSPMILLETDFQEDINVTTLPDACLHGLSSSVDHISDEHSNSEPHYIGNEMDSQGLNNLVKSDHHPDRLTVNNNENFQMCPSHLPVLEVTVQEDISTTSPLDVPSDALTSTVDHISDNDDPRDPCNTNQMTSAAQIDPVNQQFDDKPVAGPEYQVNLMVECLDMVKEKIEGAKTSNLRDSLLTSSPDNVCQSASSTFSCYSDSAVPANLTAQADERISGTSCGLTDIRNSTATGSCDSIDKLFELESHQRSRSYAPTERFFSGRKAFPPTLQKKLCKAMENIDLIDSREKLRSLGKLFSYNQNKHKKPSSAKGNQIKRPEQVNKSDMSIICKHSEKKRNDIVNERNHSGIKMPCLPSSLVRAKKGGQCIQSSSEGAIVFSKRQMQDIEALAKKLTNELSCMKEIIEERLNHETGTPNHNNDQVISAINKASKAEETARKWLSTMNRDCIRFCTIMQMNDNNNSKDAANWSRTIAEKKDSKKITFADEAGGQLCEIKFIEGP